MIPTRCVVTTREKTGPGGRANCLRYVKVSKFSTLLGHPVQVRGRITLCSERPDVGIAHVIHKHNHSVWLFLRPKG